METKIPAIRNQKLLQQALTHRSYVNEHPETVNDNERLEFLGDAVLGFVVAELIYNRYPQLSEAELTRLRSKLVDEEQLSQVARKIGISKLMQLGKGAEKDRGRDKPSLLSDTLEAIIGAYFLDSGIEAVRDYIQSLLISVADEIVSPEYNHKSQHLIDIKNRFQQWALANLNETPKYRIINESGPDHNKEFMAEVIVKGKVYGVGMGHRKQEAEKQAAENAIKKLGID